METFINLVRSTNNMRIKSDPDHFQEAIGYIGKKSETDVPFFVEGAKNFFFTEILRSHRWWTRNQL